MTELGSLGGSVQDPEPSVPRLAKLADRVLSGDIVLPKSRQQILDLLDSVSRNYPIGNVLLWQSTEQLASERSVAGLTVASQRHGYPVNYIIDGQQRLASVCGALHWRPHGDPGSKWNEAQVRAIVLAFESGTPRWRLAKQYGISVRSVGRLLQKCRAEWDDMV